MKKLLLLLLLNTPCLCMEDESDTEEITDRVITVFFEGQLRDMHNRQFSGELHRHLHRHVKERCDPIRELIKSVSITPESSLSDSSDTPPPTPEHKVRRELREVIMPALEEMFHEKDEEMRIKEEKLSDAKLKFRLALVAAGTTFITTVGTIITTLIIELSK